MKFYEIGDEAGYAICSGFGCTTNTVLLEDLTHNPDNSQTTLKVRLMRDSNNAIEDNATGIVYVNGSEVERTSVAFFGGNGSLFTFTTNQAMPGDEVAFEVISGWDDSKGATVSAVVPGDGNGGGGNGGGNGDGNGAGGGFDPTGLAGIAVIGGIAVAAIYLFGDE